MVSEILVAYLVGSLIAICGIIVGFIIGSIGFSLMVKRN